MCSDMARSLNLVELPTSSLTFLGPSKGFLQSTVDLFYRRHGGTMLAGFNAAEGLHAHPGEFSQFALGQACSDTVFNDVTGKADTQIFLGRQIPFAIGRWKGWQFGSFGQGR